MLIFDKVCWCIHRSNRNSVFIKQLQEILASAPPNDFLDCWQEPTSGLKPLFFIGQSGIGFPLVEVQCIAESIPVLVTGAGDNNFSRISRLKTVIYFPPHT